MACPKLSLLFKGSLKSLNCKLLGDMRESVVADEVMKRFFKNTYLPQLTIHIESAVIRAGF